MLRFNKKHISVLKMHKCMINSQNLFPEQWHNRFVGLMLKKQVKELILEFSISGFFNFFSEKTKLLDYYTIILVSFPLGRCVDEVVDSRENYQRYRCDIHFLWCRTLAVIHSVNGAGVC